MAEVAPLILKIGGGRDEQEFHIDPNMVVIGAHAGFMQGKDWDTKAFWTDVNKMFKSKKYKFTLIVVDNGSESWLRTKIAKEGVTTIINDFLDHSFGTVVMAADERSKQIYSTIEKHEHEHKNEHEYLKYVVSVRNKSEKGIEYLFNSFLLMLTRLPDFIVDEGNVFPFKDYKELKMTDDYKFSPRFDTLKKRKEYWNNNFKSLDEFYNWISVCALRYRVMVDDSF